jgi:N-acetylglucosaminyl-diphospho-decaprenol L-rhamnosyltransferase
MNELLPTAVFLSVIIVTYRSEREIGACLASVPVRLRGGSVEIVVVDNSPDTATAEVVARDFPQIRIIRAGKNLGFGQASNLGFRASNGEYVLFLNPDTVSTQDAYEACLKILRERPRVGIVSPRLVTADGRMDLASRRGIPTAWDGFCRASKLAEAFPEWALFSGYNLTHLDERGTYAVGAVNGAFMLTSRALLERIGLFDEAFFMYCEDLDLCHRCTLAGYENIYHGAVDLVHLKGSSSSRETERMSRELFVGAKQFYLKHFNPRGSRWVRWKYDVTFGLWEAWAGLLRKVRGGGRVRPV